MMKAILGILVLLSLVACSSKNDSVPVVEPVASAQVIQPSPSPVSSPAPSPSPTPSSSAAVRLVLRAMEATRLGEGYVLFSGETSGIDSFSSCVEGTIEKTNPEPFGRYRIETRDLGDTVRVMVTAMVVDAEVKITKPRLTSGAKTWKTQNSFSQNCRDGYVSKIEFGGRIEKTVEFWKRESDGSLPVSVPGVLEFVDSESDKARFRSVLGELLSSVGGGIKSFHSVSVVEGNEIDLDWDSIKESFRFTRADLSADPESFVKYVENYKAERKRPSVVQQTATIEKIFPAE